MLTCHKFLCCVFIPDNNIILLVKLDNSVDHIIHFCAEVLYPEVALKREGDDESFASSYASSSSGDLSSAVAHNTKKGQGFVSFCRHLAMIDDDEVRREVDNIKMSMEEKLSIFTISEKFSGGSVEVARGRKMTILPGKVHEKRYTRISNMITEARKSVEHVDRKSAFRCQKLESMVRE